MTAESIIGIAPEHLSLTQRAALRGKWLAVEIYTPEQCPLRRIEAVGNSALECMQQIQRRGLDPQQFEYELVR